MRKNREGVPRIHILSEDKKVNLEFPLFDSEVCTTRQEIERLLKRHIYPDDPWGPDDL